MNCVVIPCYRVKNTILDVIKRIPLRAEKIYVIDDGCPEGTGKYVEENCSDSRVSVIYHGINRGVGASMITGYKKALEDGAEIVVKIDGDGQMDPSQVSVFIDAIGTYDADYIKGNRFFHPEHLKGMPWIRLFGNSLLSFLNKAISGYWDIMDPANGYTAVHSACLGLLSLDKISKRYFFESDMLFRLNTIRAVVKEIPVKVKYDSGILSSLSVTKILFSFPFKYMSRFIKRIIYNYFVRDFNVGSLEIIIGVVLFLFGGIFGIYHWILSIYTGIPATAGTVIISALPIILGFQSIIASIHYDLINIPRIPLKDLKR